MWVTSHARLQLTQPLGKTMDLADRVPSSFVADASASAMLHFEDISVGDRIGAGAFSSVHRGVYNGETVAIKVVRASEDLSKYLASELAILG